MAGVASSKQPFAAGHLRLSRFPCILQIKTIVPRHDAILYGFDL